MYPKLLHVYGSLWIYGYGVMIALGFVIYSYLLYRHPLRKKYLTDNIFFNTIFCGLIAGVIGGRVAFVMQHWDDFVQNPIEVFLPWIGGLVLLGAVLGALVAIYSYLSLHKIPILPVFDLAALYAPLMQSVARLGCFLAGCCYGSVAPDWLPWAVTFTNKDGVAPLNVPLHPSQIYTSLMFLGIFFVLRFLSKRFKKDGQLFCCYFAFEMMGRFVMDFWRGDQEAFSGLLSSPQVSALKGVAFAVVCFIVISLIKKEQPK